MRQDAKKRDLSDPVLLEGLAATAKGIDVLSEELKALRVQFSCLSECDVDDWTKKIDLREASALLWVRFLIESCRVIGDRRARAALDFLGLGDLAKDFRIVGCRASLYALIENDGGESLRRMATSHSQTESSQPSIDPIATASKLT